MMHTNANRVTMLWVVALTLVMVGCGATPRSKYYQLTVPNAVAAAPSSDSRIRLLVGNISASHLYREDGIVYSHSSGEMGTYQHQRWAEPPAEMIGEVLVDKLRSSGHYLAVVPQRSNSNGDFLVRGRLYEFKEVDGGTTLARVAFELEMRDLKSGTTVWTHYYNHDEPVKGKDVPSVVAALDRNLQQGINEASTSLDQYFASRGGK